MNFLLRKKLAPFVLGAVFFIVLDRLLKILAVNYWSFKNVDIISGWFKLAYAQNRFIAFSLPIGGYLLLIINFVLLIVLFYLIKQSFQKQDIISTGLLIIILFGALSNFYDRIAYGFVIDYFDLRFFTVFNLADSMIVGSVICLLFLTKKAIKKSPGEEKKK